MKSLRFPRVAGTPLLLLWFQVAQTSPGFVTGIVRTEAGSPASRVRVYAISVGSFTNSNGTPSALDSQTETDTAGRYRLELRAGSYRIASGAISSPTYFPGTREVETARVVTLGGGETVANIDFDLAAKPAGQVGVTWKNPKEYEDYKLVYGERDMAKKAAHAEQFIIDHIAADPQALTQVYTMMILAYANDSNWTKVLETYDRISLAPKLTDKEKDQFAKIAEIARTRLR